MLIKISAINDTGKGMYLYVLFRARNCKITTKVHKPLLYLTLSTRIHTRWG